MPAREKDLRECLLGQQIAFLPAICGHISHLPSTPIMSSIFKRLLSATNIIRETPIRRRIKLGEEVKQPLVWIDCEMTGLDHTRDHIIEICCLITDGDLNLVDDDGYESLVHYDADVMDNMNEWCINQHGKSGLTSKVLAADLDRTPATVDSELLQYIRKWIPDANKALLAGSSVYMDKLFMMRELPKTVDHLHYRLMDTSALYEASRRLCPKVSSKRPSKVSDHTSRSDILESIDDLWYYKHTLFTGKIDSRSIDNFLSSATWMNRRDM